MAAEGKVLCTNQMISELLLAKRLKLSTDSSPSSCSGAAGMYFRPSKFKCSQRHHWYLFLPTTWSAGSPSRVSISKHWGACGRRHHRRSIRGSAEMWWMEEAPLSCTGRTEVWKRNGSTREEALIGPCHEAASRSTQEWYAAWAVLRRPTLNYSSMKFSVVNKLNSHMCVRT